MIFLLPSLAVYLATVAASVLHGGDYLKKGIILPLHTAVIAAALWFMGVHGYWLALSLPIMALYWFQFRMGKQAKAEMDAMAGIAPAIGAAKAYLIPLAVSSVLTLIALCVAKEWLQCALVIVPPAFLWVPPLAVKLFSYGSHVWPPTTENLTYQRKQRLKVEIAVTLAPAGLAIGLLTYAAAVAVGV